MVIQDSDCICDLVDGSRQVTISASLHEAALEAVQSAETRSELESDNLRNGDEASSLNLFTHVSRIGRHVKPSRAAKDYSRFALSDDSDSDDASAEDD